MSLLLPPKPLISVIMPAYNAQKNIGNAIDSILHQTFKRFELIIINDSSTDGTMQIVSAYAKKDSRIRIVRHTADRNIGKVLNMGIREARSDVIARMDADDISLPERLDEQYRLLNSSKKIAVVGLDIEIIDYEGNHVAARRYPTTNKEIKRCVFRYSPFAHPGVMFRKSMVEKVGMYDPAYSPSEDLDLWFRLGKYYEFASIPKTLLKYRLYPKSTSHSNIKQLEKIVFAIRMKAIIHYGYIPSAYDIIYNFIQFVTLWFTPNILRITLYNKLRNNNLI